MPGGAALPRVDGVPPLSAALFDAGLTLLQVATPTSRIAQLVLDDRLMQVDAEEVRRAMEAAEARIEVEWRLGDWFASEPGVRRLFVSSYAAGLATMPALAGGGDLAWQVANEMYDRYGRAEHWALYPDVLPTMEALALAGVAMGVISDWGHGLEALLLELGLGPYVGFMVVSARLGVTKPDPVVFRMALERMGVAPAAAIYVGDTYVKDVLGARAAGIIPVLLDREGRAPSVDCPTIRTLADLLPLVGLVGGQATAGPHGRDNT